MKIVVACAAGALAVLVVLALPILVPDTGSRTGSGERRRQEWDSTSGGAQAGLESIARGTHAAALTRRTPDPVANVRDVSARYTAARLAEIRDELARIEASEWKSQADLDRRQALLDEQHRLLRY